MHLHFKDTKLREEWDQYDMRKEYDSTKRKSKQDKKKSAHIPSFSQVGYVN